MENNIIQLTENELQNIIRKCIIEVINNNDMLLEMAVSRSDYITHCINQSSVVYKHIAKILIYENDPNMRQYINHWCNEISTQIYDLFKMRVKDDNKAGDKTKKTFITGFITSRLGDNFCDYEEIYSYFYDALEDEGLNEEQIKNIPYKEIALKNKQRVINYISKFIPLITIKDATQLKKDINNIAKII